MLAAVCACSSASPASTDTTTITVKAHPPLAGQPSATPTKPKPTPPPVQHRLPGTCDSLLPLLDVEAAMGRTVTGRTQFVVGVPEPKIKRLAYLNCRYGFPRVATRPRQPLVEIGISLYATAAQAHRRLKGTVDDYQFNGATVASRRVGGRAATLLSGGEGPGYDVPLLVLQSGQRTIAVSLAVRAGPPTYRSGAMIALAELALLRTGR